MGTDKGDRKSENGIVREGGKQPKSPPPKPEARPEPPKNKK